MTLRGIAVAVSFLALAGCASPPKEAKMYDGPVQTGREVILQTDSPAGNRSVSITKVDGARPLGGAEALLGGGARTVYLLPGRHTVEAKFTEGSSFAYSRNLSFAGEPGKVYFVRAEPASRNFLGTTSVRFWIQDGTGNRVSGVDVSSGEPPGAVASAPAAAALPPRPSGCTQLSFTDGSSACMVDFEVLSVKIGMPGGLSVLDRANAARTFAYATSEAGPGCQATYGMAWNNPNGDDDERAHRQCETVVKKDTRNLDGCRCSVTVPAGGRVPITQKEFVAKTFALYYRLLDSYRASNQFQSQWGEIVQLKKTLQAREQAHYQRLAGVARSGMDAPK